MIGASPVATAVIGAAGALAMQGMPQAIDQIAPAPPRDRASTTQQVSTAPADPLIAQLPDQPRDVPQPAPRPTPPATGADIDRVAAVILSPTAVDTPTRVGSELGLDTIRQVARDAAVAPGGQPPAPLPPKP